MSWSISLKLMPGEEIIDDSSRHKSSVIKPAYSVFLTNKRAIFRFDSLGSSLSQAFTYEEIAVAIPKTRLLIDYLFISTPRKDLFINTSNAGYWAERIMEIKKSLQKGRPSKGQEGGKAAESHKPAKTAAKSPDELEEMLRALKEHELLSAGEYDDKLQRLKDGKLGG